MGIAHQAQKLDGSLRRVLKIVIDLASHYGGVVNLPFLLNVIAPATANDYERDKQYAKLRRDINKLRDMGLVSVEKFDGLVWVSPTPKAFYLMHRRRNSNHRRRVMRPEKERAIQLLQYVNDPGYFVWSKDGTNKLAELIVGEFEEYLDYVENTRVVLVRRELVEGNVPTLDELGRLAVDDSDVLVVQYRTRFTSKSMLAQKLERYDALFKVASSRYTDAVFLTLTTDPSRFSNIYEANRYFGHALNRFMSRLRRHLKRRGQRLEYLSVYEFTKSGLLHAHIIIFGVRYLLPVRRISKWWREAGQGRVVYIYRLRNVDGQWVWVRRRPRDTRAGEGAEDYLKKYLKKALRLAGTLDTSDVKKVLPLALYWAFNKRFFTYSRSLLPHRTVQHIQNVSEYVFVGVFSVQNIPDWIWYLPHRVYQPSHGPPPRSGQTVSKVLV